MDAVNAALFSKLDTDRQSAAAGSLGDLGVTAIANKVAGHGAELPFVLFQKQAGDSRYAFAQLAYRDLVYLVKAVAQGTSDMEAAQIDARLDALLTDQTLTVTGYSTMVVRRMSDVDYAEVVQGETYFHVGALYAISVDPA